MVYGLSVMNLFVISIAALKRNTAILREVREKSGANVVLATPTGSGKSLVATGAQYAALAAVSSGQPSDTGYVANRPNNLSTITHGGDPFNRPTRLSVAQNGDLYVSDTANHRIRKISGGVVSGVGLATAHSRMEGLRRQCATEIVALEFLSAADATTRFGTGYPNGAILITTHGEDRADRRYALDVPKERVRYSTDSAHLTLGDASVRLLPDGRVGVYVTTGRGT